MQRLPALVGRPLGSLVITSFSTNPIVNCAFEEWILRNSHAEKRILMLWRNNPSVFIGRNQNPWRECNLSLAKKVNIPIVRRYSGGGTVYHDLGNCNYSYFTAKKDFSRTAALELIIQAMRPLTPLLEISAFHDILLSVNGHKVSGSAYRLTQNRAYHHGTFLVDADLTNLAGLLRPPIDDACFEAALVLPSRRSPVSNIRQFVPTFQFNHFFSHFSSAYLDRHAPGEEIVVCEDEILGLPGILSAVEELRTAEWTLGKTPDFKVKLRSKILCISKGRLTDILDLKGKPYKVGQGKDLVDSYLDLSTALLDN